MTSPAELNAAVLSNLRLQEAIRPSRLWRQNAVDSSCCSERLHGWMRTKLAGTLSGALLKLSILPTISSPPGITN
jgi:hypothetical protein